jgi:hypothetical protein
MLRNFSKKEKEEESPACRVQGSAAGLQLRARFVPAALLAVLSTGQCGRAAAARALCACCAAGYAKHNAAKQHLGLIAPAGHGARRTCVNQAAPSGWQCVGSPEAGGGRGLTPSPLEQEQPLQGLECLRAPPWPFDSRCAPSRRCPE